ALRAGIPQLIQPYAFDQFDNGARIEKLGVGRTISRRAFHEKRIVQDLEHLLTSPKVRTACHTIQKIFSETDPLAASCILIESLMD
ncbi:MAG: glycosyltransferase, partial [Nitrospirota bacterium]|nr:glycosyltransferase [Nitrospirota bacterium]